MIPAPVSALSNNPVKAIEKEEVKRDILVIIPSSFFQPNLHNHSHHNHEKTCLFDDKDGGNNARQDSQNERTNDNDEQPTGIPDDLV